MSVQDYTIAKGFPLTEEQNEIIEYVLQRPMAICSAQTGIGKTLTMSTAAIHLMLTYDDLHFVIICPQKAVKAFRRELGRIGIGYNELSSSTHRFSTDARITLLTHTMVEKHIQELVDLRAKYRLGCIVDEIHAAQDCDSKFYQIMMRIRPMFAVFWGATATPLKNDITGLYWMVHLVSPGFFGSWQAFKMMYLVTRTNTIRQKIWKGGKPILITRNVEEIVGYRNVEALSKKLDDIIIIRQLQYNLKFHYAKVPLTSEEEHFYLMAGKGLFMKEETKDVWAARLHQLQRIIDNVHEEHVTSKNKLSSKEKCLMKVILDLMKNREPILIYFDYKDALERIKYILGETKQYTGIKQILEVSGSINQKQREKVEEQIDAGTVVLVTQAGTESINLQRANTVIFYDIPFAVQTFIQMVGRVTRMDSKFDHQDIYFIEAEGTSDTYRRILLQMNGSLINQIFGKVNTLPLELKFIDKKRSKQLRDALLWSFKAGKLATQDVIDRIVKLDDGR